MLFYDAEILEQVNKVSVLYFVIEKCRAMSSTMIELNLIIVADSR